MRRGGGCCGRRRRRGRRGRGGGSEVTLIIELRENKCNGFIIKYAYTARGDRLVFEQRATPR